MISIRSRHSPQTDESASVAHGPGRTTLIAGIALLVSVAVIYFLVWEGESFGSTDGGHVAIVRNGGPFDNTKIRQVLQSSSGRTNIGMYSSMHEYPTSQRFFTISSSANADSNESVTVPTSDGVNVGIEGTAYFTINTLPGSDGSYSVLKAFDNAYGTRKFNCPDKNSRSVWEGDAGFSCFLDQIVEPVINNDLRTSVGDVRCQDLVSSCSLVQNATATVDPSTVGAGNVNLAKIEAGISSSLLSDLNETLGGPYLTNVRFNLAKIDLDPSVQAAISKAQSAFASVSQSQADLKNAQIEARANAAKQAGYAACPVCAQIDLTQALPKGITVYAPGNGNIAIPTK
ncbi:SPFH domain/Band 7 family protein [Jatrophihabitans sp. GAS493]|uniref:SPFH domain-containing protein n=1 Tax=Jatrophihabitans sp. GAS493 TaxID=1907575 RepID=UPI000BB7A9C4|nr:SPFH domain-containing protein [Jatrophihabitans sp. GAS493]SOD71012.1 SPFH domain/Band 7 family protein [Jatrophihabitans sp. GAS493]